MCKTDFKEVNNVFLFFKKKYTKKCLFSSYVMHIENSGFIFIVMYVSKKASHMHLSHLFLLPSGMLLAFVM